jgi:hypothetical protein
VVVRVYINICHTLTQKQVCKYGSDLSFEGFTFPFSKRSVGCSSSTCGPAIAHHILAHASFAVLFPQQCEITCFPPQRVIPAVMVRRRPRFPCRSHLRRLPRLKRVHIQLVGCPVGILKRSSLLQSV